MVARLARKITALPIDWPLEALEIWLALVAGYVALVGWLDSWLIVSMAAWPPRLLSDCLTSGLTG
jgi:hypothetical protein